MKRFMVEWVAGYLGGGVNDVRRESFASLDGANKFVSELKCNNHIGVRIYSY